MKSPINSAEKKKPTTIQVVLFTVIICLLVAIAFAGGVLVGYYVNEEPFDYYDYDYYYGIEETGEDLSRASARRLHPTFSKPSIHYSIKEITSELKSTNHLERLMISIYFLLKILNFIIVELKIRRGRYFQQLQSLGSIIFVV